MKKLLVASIALLSMSANAGMYIVKEGSGVYSKIANKFDFVEIVKVTDEQGSNCYVKAIKDGQEYNSEPKRVFRPKYNADPLSACLTPSQASELASNLK